MELQANYAKIQEAGAELIAISSDNVAPTKRTVDDQGLTYLVLSDNKKQVIDLYNVRDQSNPVIARPAAYIIRSDGVIAWRSLDTAGVRVPTATILTELGKL